MASSSNLKFLRRVEESVLDKRRNKQREEVEIVSEEEGEDKKKFDGRYLYKMKTIVREDSMLNMPSFHRNGKEDLEQHWSMCE